MDVALAVVPRGADGFHVDAVLGLELVVEVAIATVLAVVSHDAGVSVIFPAVMVMILVGGGDGHGHDDQAGEDHLLRETGSHLRPKWRS